MDEPVCFVRSHREMAHDFMPALVPGYRRLEPGWLAEAASRVRAVVRAAVLESRQPDHDEIIAALFPPPDPEPEDWEREAARTWNRDICLGNTIGESKAAYEERLARHFAKARRAREEKR